MRDASFDYCFNYFQSFRDDDRVFALCDAENLERSCLTLGFYLASWGMYRGSTQLLQRSARHLAAIVDVIAHSEPDIWTIDLHEYDDQGVHTLTSHASDLRASVDWWMTDTLVTKIMLGVYGNVPAFDQYFCRGFGCSTLGKKSLVRIGAFYVENAEIIDESRISTLDFLTGSPTDRLYTRAKMLDMAFFAVGVGGG
jgi:hypothetical protein